MATRYRFGDSEYPHFITFAVINWIDALSRPAYKDIIVESLKYCQQEKGLIINGWIIMNNHVHLISRCKAGFALPDVIRDLKKFTSRKIEEAIRENTFESRKEWMLWIACPLELRDLKEPDNEIAITKIFSFGNRIIIQLNCMDMKR